MADDPQATQRAATMQATLAIGALLVVLAVLGFFALRDTGRAAGTLAGQVGELLTREPAPPVVVEAPVPTVAEAVIPAGSEPEGPTAVQDAVAACVPKLLGLAEGVRLLAVDASVNNVDFIQESAGTPDQFVRLTCDWNGSTFELSDAGRMVVPPMVGDPAALPAELIDESGLDPGFFTTQIDAAVQAAREPGMIEVRRVEISHVAGHGVLTRVRFERATGLLDIVLDLNGSQMPAATRFPQVERMPGLTAEDAELGYRDRGQTLWTSGVAESVDRMRDRYFNGGEKLHAIELVGRRVTAYLADARDARATQVVVIDEYGDKLDPEPSQRTPQACAKPFTARDARTALDAAIRARGETLATFEAIQFESAILDCRAHARRPTWRFAGG